jgi:glycerate-2-kinase
VIGRFPWDPFPPGEPEPTGDDPFLGAVYRAAVQGADAYRAVRTAVRREQGVLRVGNRFVPDGRYREVAFVALGHAATSMGLAALHIFGDRLTQGFVAGPEEPPAALPFRSETVGDGWGGSEAAPRVLEAAREIAGELRESDLFLLLLSPGAVRSLLLPPPGLTAPALADLLRALHRAGSTGRDVAAVARVLGDGGVGGRLLPARVVADVQCLIVDRGDGPVSVGGGPTFPVGDGERESARATLDRAGQLARLPREVVGRLEPTGGEPRAVERRPVVVAAPADGLRAAADVVFDKGWTARVGVLGLGGGPEEAADRFLASVENVVATERASGAPPSKGLVVFGTTTLGVPEGVDERPACEACLARALGGLRRREMSLGLFRTSGPTGPGPGLAGAVIGAPGDPASKAPAHLARPIRMRHGITDVGVVLAAVVPAPAGAGRGRRGPST